MLRKIIHHAILIFVFASVAQLGSAHAAACSLANGQELIDSGEYEQAVKEFSCSSMPSQPRLKAIEDVIEAQLLLGRYLDAVRDYTRITAVVIPVHPDAQKTILAGYSARLAVAPDSIPALTGESFAYWWFFKYSQAVHTINHLLEVQPENVYGNLFRGSSRLLQGNGAAKTKGMEDIEHAISLASGSADIRFIVADAYTYGVPNPERAFAEANLALLGGLDTPRIHAILGSSYNAFGDLTNAAIQIQKHIDLVTTEVVATPPISTRETFELDLAPGRTYAIPVEAAAAGERISITTSSKDFFDTILVLLDPNGIPILGANDTIKYYAAFDWTVNSKGTYKVLVTSFEAVSTGQLVVARN